MNAFCEKLGGTLVVVLSVTLMAATLLLVHTGRCAADVGFGFITASLLPVAMGRSHHRKHRVLQEQIAATKADVRSIVAAHANDLRQHVTQTVDATTQKLDGLAAGLQESQGQVSRSKVQRARK